MFLEYIIYKIHIFVRNLKCIGDSQLGCIIDKNQILIYTRCIGLFNSKRILFCFQYTLWHYIFHSPDTYYCMLHILEYPKSILIHKRDTLCCCIQYNLGKFMNTKCKFLMIRRNRPCILNIQLGHSTYSWWSHRYKVNKVHFSHSTHSRRPNNCWNRKWYSFEISEHMFCTIQYQRSNQLNMNHTEQCYHMSNN